MSRPPLVTLSSLIFVMIWYLFRRLRLDSFLHASLSFVDTLIVTAAYCDFAACYSRSHITKDAPSVLRVSSSVALSLCDRQIHRPSRAVLSTPPAVYLTLFTNDPVYIISLSSTFSPPCADLRLRCLVSPCSHPSTVTYACMGAHSVLVVPLALCASGMQASLDRSIRRAAFTSSMHSPVQRACLVSCTVSVCPADDANFALSQTASSCHILRFLSVFSSP
jgi:hypothetical protein